MSDYQTIQVADALVSGLRRFPDPLASVFVLMDFLSLSLGEKALIRLEKDDWPLCNDPDDDVKEILCGSAVQFGDVNVSVDGEFEFLSSLPEILDLHTSGAVAEIAGRFEKAKNNWTAPDNDFEWPLSIGAEAGPLEDFAKAVQKLVDESTEKSGFGLDAQILDVIALTSPDDGEHQFCRLTNREDHSSSEGDLIPGTLMRSSKTGFVQWSARIPLDGSHLLVVPCMVANVPWALVVCRCSEPFWRNGISLYRDKLPRVLEGLRMSAQSAFLSSVLKTLEDQLLESDWKPQQLNEKWASLGRYFPFKIPKLVKASSVGEHNRLSKLIRLSDEDWIISPSENSNFKPLISDEKRSWGDIGGLADTLERAIVSRLAAAQKATENLAQTVAHEYKNLTGDVADLAEDVHLNLAFDQSVTDDIKLSIHRISRQCSQLNRWSLALFSLVKQKSEAKFKQSADALTILRAALRIMLEFRLDIETSEQSVIIEDELSFEDAVRTLHSAYGGKSGASRRRRLSTEEILDALLKKKAVQFLLFAVAEPVRNAQPDEDHQELPPSVRLWTGVDTERKECLLFQRTIEPANAEKTPFSYGSERSNKILPKAFCRIEPNVEFLGAEETDYLANGSPALKITRVTRIEVFGIPC